MASSRLQNALLFVIALFLGLIVIHLYSDVDLVAKAQAQAETTDSQEVHLRGWYCSFGDCKWKSVAVDGNGRLLTSSK